MAARRADGSVVFIIDQLLRRFRASLWGNNRLASGMLGMAAAVLIAFYGIRPYAPVHPYRYGPVYVGVSQWVQQNTPEGTAIATTEIGYVGYFSRRPIVDRLGLIHSEVLAAMAEAEMDWWYRKDPEVILFLQEFDWWMRPEYRTDFDRR